MIWFSQFLLNKRKIVSSWPYLIWIIWIVKQFMNTLKRNLLMISFKLLRAEFEWSALTLKMLSSQFLHKGAWKVFKNWIDTEVWQFFCIPNGYSDAMRIFTKISEKFTLKKITLKKNAWVTSMLLLTYYDSSISKYLMINLFWCQLKK